MADKMYSDMVLLERVTGAQQMLTTDHAILHEGLGYSIDTRNAALADSAYLSIAIKSPLDTYVHLKRYEPQFVGDYGVFTVIEGCSIAGGAGVARNRNRIATHPLASEIKTGVTITGGTEIEGFFCTGGAGIGTEALHGGRATDIEWVLAPGIQYALKLLNSSGGAALCSLWAFLYEEEKG